MTTYTDISQEWKNQCQHIKQISHPIDLKSFGFDKMQRDMQMEFKVVQFMTQTQKHLKKLYTNPDHFSFNRNSNIMTYDQNRVLLSQETEKDAPDNYINANFIEVCDHKIIATQGPLQSTFNNFWRMIIKYKVQAIFMLCERIEKQQVKCDLYWPNKIEQPLEVGDFQVKLMKREEDGKYTKIRTFQIKNKITKQQHSVKQYQFVGWPDKDRPLEASQNSLNKLLQIMANHVQKNQLVAVHCSAGVGRTGTFIAMCQIKMLIPKTQSISIFDLVRKLREQRWAMVYNEIQYQYLYQFTEKQSMKFFQPEKAICKDCEQFSDSDIDVQSLCANNCQNNS